MTSPIKLTEAAKFYKALPHQVKAFEELQAALPPELIAKFAETYRTAPEPKPLISADQFHRIFGAKPQGNQLQDLNACLERFAINTPPRMRHFLSQIGHESGGLRWMKEIDPGWYIPERFGVPAIAGSDGGYKYRGAGVIQLSLPDNYKAFADFMGDAKIYHLGCPYVADTYPFTSAGFWWMNNNMNALCDRGATVTEVTRRVNGGTNGLSDRIRWYELVCRVI